MLFRSSQAKSALLSHMSHELRTPLNAVLGFAQLLQTELGRAPLPRQHERLQLLLQSGWHLLGMIDELLDLSRIEAGQLALDCRTVALAPLLGEADDVQRNTRLPQLLGEILLDARAFADDRFDGLEVEDAVVADEGGAVALADRKSTRLNSSHIPLSRMPSSA